MSAIAKTRDHTAPTAETVPIESVHTWAGNARVHNLEAIRESLRAHGQYRPLVVQKRTRRIVAGNGTWEAAKAEGWTEIRVEFFDLTDEQARRILLVDNRTNDLASYDNAALVGLLRSLPDLAGTGYQPSDLTALIASLAPSRRRASPDDVPEQPTEPRTQPGQLWRLGSHRLLCGDTTVPEDVAKLLAGERPDMVLTDPPFAIYGSSTGIGRDIADDKMVRPFFEGMWRVIAGVLPEFGHAYVHCDWRSWSAVWEGAKRGGVVVKNMLVWDKGGGGLGANYANSYELLCFAAKLPPSHTMTSSERGGQRTVNRSNILRFPRASGDDRQHNAAKPVALLSEMIEASSDAGGSVMDLYGGSGSTLIAAERLGRRSFVMEIEPRWCDVICARFQAQTDVQPVDDASGEAFNFGGD